MRWPFGPPHLTLKPSNKKHQKNKKKTNKKKPNKKTKKKKKKKPPPQKKQQNHQKIAFQLSVKFFLFFGWLFKISLFWHLGPESAHPKNTIKIGVSGPFFLKSSCVSRNGRFWTKKPKIYKFQLSFFFAYFLLFQKQKNKHLLKPLFL